MWTSLLIGALVGTAWSTDVWRNDAEDGSIKFTDQPPNTADYYLFMVDGPPPEVRHVNLRNFPLLDTWDPLIVNAAVRYGVPSALIKAVCLAESGMNSNAKSRAGAIGLMQLMPGTAGDLGVIDSLDPEENIDGGVRYLKKMLRTFHGDKTRALAGYNAGPNAVKRYSGVPPYTETQTYVKRVLELYRYFKLKRPIKERATP